jgi:hypothetical protein
VVRPDGVTSSSSDPDSDRHGGGDLIYFVVDLLDIDG